MDKTTRIKELWDYLKIQDDEALIIQSYNASKDSDEFIVTTKSEGVLETSVYDCLPDLMLYQSFRLIQQRDSDDKHIIPLVSQLKNDEQIDY